MKGETMSRKHLWVYVTASLALLGALVWAGLVAAAPGSEPADTPQSSPFTPTKTGDTNDGLCGTLDCSLREAISSGDSGDTVNIPTGVYTLTLGTELTIGTNLILNGAGSGDTIIQAAASSADATSRVFNITGGAVAISGVAVQNGNTTGDGGGISNFGTLTLTDSTVSGNTATFTVGGGIYTTLALQT